jgi:competence protein ComEC
MKQPKNLTFLTFTAYRIVMFAGLCGIVLFAHFFGPLMWRFYIGTGNAFHYEVGTLVVHYLDVGQGDAIIIQLPDGRIVMIDSGTHHYYSRVSTYLTTRILKGDNRTIDFVIATHSHDDHIGGFAQLLEDFEVDTVFRPHNKSLSGYDTGELGDGALVGEALGPLQTTLSYANFITAAYTFANQVYFIEAGLYIKCDLDTYLLYFHTPSIPFIERLCGDDFADFNNISSIISLSYKNHVFIFTGDAGMKTEDAFRDCLKAQSIDFANLEVYLKVAHHGSHNNTFHNFLAFIQPNKAIISVGARNLHGHPRPQVFDRLMHEDIGLRYEDILETRHLGHIALATDGTTDRLFFAFDNEPDLRFMFIIFVPIFFFVCFANFRIVKRN